MVRKAHKRIRKSEKKNAEFQFLSSDLCILISPGFNSPQLAAIIEVKFQKHDTPRLAAERFHLGSLSMTIAAKPKSTKKGPENTER